MKTCVGPHQVGKFEHCDSCGRTGSYAFGPNVRPKTAWRIETAVEWIEGRQEPFTASEVQRVCGGYGTAQKVIRILEHHGHLRRVGHAPNNGRRGQILWQTVRGAS